MATWYYLDYPVKPDNDRGEFAHLDCGQVNLSLREEKASRRRRTNLKMNKKELIEKLEDIEWEDFEIKEARQKFPKAFGRLFLHFRIRLAYYPKAPIVEGGVDYYRIIFPLAIKKAKKKMIQDKKVVRKRWSVKVVRN